jgi:hypothetical protein
MGRITNAKRSVRFDRFLYVQINKPVKSGIERQDNWENSGGVRRCSFRFDSGNTHNAQFTDNSLLTATARLQYDPGITEKMRIVLVGKHGDEAFKIIAVMPDILYGRRVSVLRLQRWSAL